MKPLKVELLAGEQISPPKFLLKGGRPWHRCIFWALRTDAFAIDRAVGALGTGGRLPWAPWARRRPVLLEGTSLTVPSDSVSSY